MEKRQIHLNGEWVDYSTIPDCTPGKHTPINKQWREGECMRRCKKCGYPLWNAENYLKVLQRTTEDLKGKTPLEAVMSAIAFDASEEHLYIAKQNDPKKYI